MFRPLKPYQLAIDLVVAGLFGVVALAVEIQFLRSTGMTLGSLSWVLVTLFMTAALALRRASPGLALGLAWVGAVAQMGFGRPPGPVDIAIFAVLYATAAYGSRLVFWMGFASSFVGALVITIYLVLGPYFGSGGVTWSTIPTALAVLVAAGFALLLSWTVGALVRTARGAQANRRAQQRAEAEALVEQERVGIARDMHDVVAHSLAVVIAQADGARYAAASDPALAVDALTTISATARSALADVRLLLGQLRHTQGDGPQPTLADLETLYAQVRRSGVDLRVTVDPAAASEPPAGTQLAVYRILQEALTNALRHGTGPVEVRLAWHADRVELEVRNPLAASAPAAVPQSRSVDVGVGSGRAATGERATAGHGIIGMRERAQLAGGTLTATAADGAFAVSGTLPIGGLGS